MDYLNNDIAIIILTTSINHNNSISVDLVSNINLIQNNDEILVIGYGGLCKSDNFQGGSDIDTLESSITHFMTETECYRAFLIYS